MYMQAKITEKLKCIQLEYFIPNKIKTQLSLEKLHKI